MANGGVDPGVPDAVRAFIMSWLPRRAAKDAKEGHVHAGGDVLQAEATVDLTLTTSAQSFTGTGDSSKVRLLLDAGTWGVLGVCVFLRGADPSP